MDAKPSQERPPQDLVAIFHASFHPTKGNLIDWYEKADDSVDLTHVEFSCLPSGLHSINEDVVYFTKGEHRGVCVFRRRQTAEHGHRGFRLSSLGVLLAPALRARPWRHVPALKALVQTIYTSLEDRAALEPTADDWAPARAFFDERRARQPDLGGAGAWNGWAAEMETDAAAVERGAASCSGAAAAAGACSSPTVRLPHLLQILGPSSLTLYKHVLGRRRILIYTLPPVEAACVLCQVAADLCFEEQVAPPPGKALLLDADDGADADTEARRRLKGKSKEGIRVLGMVTLSDIDRLELESKSGRGWIACTTDAIFLEKPSYYDLLIDLTTTASKSARPTFATSKLFEQAGGRRPAYKLSAVRFTWSDIKLWTELDRIIQEDAEEERSAPSSPSFGRQRQGANNAGWPDVWKVYEDVCVICAGLWMGGPWRGGPERMENWGSAREESEGAGPRGYVRNVGMGIEGRARTPPDSSPDARAGITELGELSLRERAARRVRRTSGGSLLWSWASGRASGSGSGSPARRKSLDTDTDADADADEEDADEDEDEDADIVLVQDARERQAAAALALLRVFHAHTAALLARLADVLPQRTAHSHHMAHTGAPVVLTPRDLLAFDLGPLSGLDAHFVEWLAEEYGGGVRVVVRRGWRDVVALIFGL